MSWLKKSKEGLKTPQRKRELPDGLWTKCEDCGEILYHKELERNLWTCTKCSYHFRISARTYLKILLDEGSFVERFSEVVSTDPLKFRDTKRYSDRLRKAREETSLSEAILMGEGTIEGRPLVIGVMDFSFLGGSLASASGERIARGILLALETRRPLVLLSSSGGARMFEGILSLMQMAKTNALLARLSDAGVPYISIMTHPTTGGVTASFASVGDVILAEPRALIGFAGPRVIKQTINQELPEGFQRSEFLLAKGMVDRIVHRNELRRTLAWLLHFFAAAALLPQKPRRRAGETLARFRAVGGPVASTPPPPPAPEVQLKPFESESTPSVNGAPGVESPEGPARPPAETPGETSGTTPGGSAAFPADREIPIRE
ncbi:MAG: acetyl-CoA carboxylase carboxyltransferase subunit beta [Candidatus Eisenbacteria bacterium]|uniref:Acetyl-coenzyme A carboxylase carboxyl transferase subunit beta n=1 Tax=Eiseniibacteriota bacterium TaxID=2212470 RepID=A0A538T4N6_UNCEI|nr:MAG: acetyl-CoA carboxylase carboxyltransferase subunit beta [Candidatus Eisenbacteria bacterium]